GGRDQGGRWHGLLPVTLGLAGLWRGIGCGLPGGLGLVVFGLEHPAGDPHVDELLVGEDFQRAGLRVVGEDAHVPGTVMTATPDRPVPVRVVTLPYVTPTVPAPYTLEGRGMRLTLLAVTVNDRAVTASPSNGTGVIDTDVGVAPFPTNRAIPLPVGARSPVVPPGAWRVIAAPACAGL